MFFINNKTFISRISKLFEVKPLTKEEVEQLLKTVSTSKHYSI
jgi:replication-associated recombination protein RarA